MTVGELHRRIFIMGYYLNQASSALAAGDQETAVAQFDRFQKAYDEVDDEVLLPLYPTQYHLLDELTEGLETVFLFDRSEGINNAEPLLAAIREQLLDVAHDLEARMSAEGAEVPLPLPDLVSASGS
jgi:phosphoglycolate phosphatase-like HAD superfamily hydrolase